MLNVPAGLDRLDDALSEKLMKLLNVGNVAGFSAGVPEVYQEFIAKRVSKGSGIFSLALLPLILSEVGG